MKSKTIKNIAIIALCLCSLSAVFVPSVHAGKTNSSNITSICDDDNIPAEVRAASGCDDNTKDELAETVTGILNAIIAVSGLISVIFIIVGGINYMTSIGDPGKIKKSQRHHPLCLHRAYHLCPIICYCQLRHQGYPSIQQ